MNQSTEGIDISGTPKLGDSIALTKEVERLLPQRVNEVFEMLDQNAISDANGRIESAITSLKAYWNGPDSQLGCRYFKYRIIPGAFNSRMEDDFYRFSWKRVLIKKELEKLQKLEELHGLTEGIAVSRTKFFEALCVGVLRSDNNSIVYPQVIDDVVLWQRGKGAKIFTAYNEFSRLYADRRSEIDEKIIAANATVSVDLAKAFLDRYTPELVKAEISQITAAADRNSAYSVYTDFIQYLKNFILMNQ